MLQRNPSLNEEILRQYRIYHLGIVNMRNVERQTENDLKIANTLLTRSPGSEVLSLYALQVSKATKEFMDGFYGAFQNVRSFILETKPPKIEDRILLNRLFDEQIPDSLLQAGLEDTIRIFGGMDQVLGCADEIFSLKKRAYDEICAMLEEDSGAVNSAVQRLSAYKGELKTLEQYWKDRLTDALKSDEEAQKEGSIGMNYMFVVWELCSKHPELAEKLGIDCEAMKPHDFYCLMFGWVGVAVTIGTIIAIYVWG